MSKISSKVAKNREILISVHKKIYIIQRISHLCLLVLELARTILEKLIIVLIRGGQVEQFTLAIQKRIMWYNLLWSHKVTNGRQLRHKSSPGKPVRGVSAAEVP